jgi:serine O-acetyltransferase
MESIGVGFVNALLREACMADPGNIVEFISSKDIWYELRQDAIVAASKEAFLSGYLKATILNYETMQNALAYNLAHKLGGPGLTAAVIEELCRHIIADEPDFSAKLVQDLRAVRERDPACRSYLQPFLYFKGFVALEASRVAHSLWKQGREILAFHLQNRISEILQVDIHPAACLGLGLFLDHATGIVIGETTVIGDRVSILQSVTLGGNGKERGDRHPKIGRGVLISVGAKILGNIRVGEEARIAAGSVVLNDVPAHTTVAGVPARIVRGPACIEPAMAMDHFFGEGI